MKKNWVFVLILATLTACSLPSASTPAPIAPADTATLIAATETATLIPPTETPEPTITPIPETIVLDFVASLCDSQWMNGVQNLTACPDASADRSGGYAMSADPSTQGLPAGTPVLMMFPPTNGYGAVFLRYPAVPVQVGDHFRATLQCPLNTACAVDYRLEYYDANGKYHSPFLTWNHNNGQGPLSVDEDLSLLAGQSIEFVLAIQPNNNSPQFDSSLWIAPVIYRVGP